MISGGPGEQLRPGGVQPLLALAFLGSGAALVMAILFGAPLGLLLALVGVFTGITLVLKWRHTATAARPLLQARLVTGLVAGALATGGYDAVRWMVVTLGWMEFWPFDSFPLFGALILGPNAPRIWTQVVGIAYHLMNGVGFAVAYCLLLGGRDWRLGVVWALGLELAMVSLYPSWLNLDAVLREFTVVSLVGHVTYGAVLGAISQRRLTGVRRYEQVYDVLARQQPASGRPTSDRPGTLPGRRR